MIRCVGELSIDDINDANIPVTCVINSPAEDTNQRWSWTAVNFMAAHGQCGGSWRVEADSLEELIDWVRATVVPLYEAAAQNMKERGENLYWSI